MHGPAALALHAARRTRGSPGRRRSRLNTCALDRPHRGLRVRAPTAACGKLRLCDGQVLWTTSITHDPTHEKITSSLNVSRGLVIATTGGYIGDAPPYQGHVVTMFESTGASRTSGTRCARTGTR